MNKLLVKILCTLLIFEPLILNSHPIQAAESSGILTKNRLEPYFKSLEIKMKSENALGSYLNDGSSEGVISRTYSNGHLTSVGIVPNGDLPSLIFTSSKRSTTPDLVRVGSQRLDLSLEMKKAKSITFDLFKSEGKSLTHALSDPNLGPKTIQRILDQLSSPLNDVKQKLSQLSLANAIPSKSNRASRSIASVKDVLSAIIYASILAICVAFIIIEAGILLGVAIIAGVAALFLVVTRGGNISPPQPAQ